ncbi:DUF3413 domain-containing protein [Alteromonas halophila]|uniref:Inner membrane protein YejM N-terminal domain-containing protein n=1 Tax=Alteromonas halophila TaxID=516698 RepID=A0A918JLK8_9ALTE|nr:DUF3413 domain-containing protein [Alteromonas halophila]GGW88274.1 hypothetical protein GCM10007391_22680 [Alteromonas halophila]
MILAESPRRQRVTKLVNWGHWFALANIVIALIIASIFIFSSPAPGTGLGSLYLFTNWFGHIGFMTFFGFVIFVLPLCYLVSNASVIKAVASVIAAVGLALLAFDALLFNRTGFHLNSNSADLLRGDVAIQLSQLGWQQWGFLLLLFVVWLGFQLVLANALWKRVERFSKYRIGVPVTTFFVLCFVTSHAVHVWADAHLYQPIIKQDNMFPLSYPATAKTTMSRYGLLDMDAYLKRKQLQFDPQVHQIHYPAEPVYCAIDTSRNISILVQTDDGELPSTATRELRALDNYYTTASSADSLVMTTLYGVPEIYQETLKQKRPVMLALASGLGMPVSVHIDKGLPTDKLKQYQQPLNPQANGLQVAFLPASKISDYIASTNLNNESVIIATGFGQEGGASRGQLYTNMALRAGNASTEDLVPTVLGALGCNAPVMTYSTGQNLLAPSRNWLVSTSGERVIVIHDGKRTDVLSNGSYEITDIESGNRSNESLNVDMLSRAIKHLSRFSVPR